MYFVKWTLTLLCWLRWRIHYSNKVNSWRKKVDETVTRAAEEIIREEILLYESCDNIIFYSGQTDVFTAPLNYFFPAASSSTTKYYKNRLVAYIFFVYTHFILTAFLTTFFLQLQRCCCGIIKNSWIFYKLWLVF